MGQIKTYNPKEVHVVLGHHIVTGYAEDSFIAIEPNGDGVTKKIGCDGEIVRSISPDDTFNVKLSLLYGSPTNAFLQTQFNRDIKDGQGTFPLMVTDLRGGLLFHADAAWPAKAASRAFGKESGDREWELQTGSATIRE